GHLKQALQLGIASLKCGNAVLSFDHHYWPPSLASGAVLTSGPSPPPISISLVRSASRRTRRTFLSLTAFSPRSSGLHSSATGYDPLAGRRLRTGAVTPGAMRLAVSKNPV